MTLKMTGKLYAKDGMSKDEFVNYWLTKHAPLVKQTFGDKLKKYVISIVVAADGEEPGYQGTAELWFDSMADIQTTMSSPSVMKQFGEDQANFARKITIVYTEEHTMV